MGFVVENNLRMQKNGETKRKGLFWELGETVETWNPMPPLLLLLRIQIIWIWMDPILFYFILLLVIVISLPTSTYLPEFLLKCNMGLHQHGPSGKCPSALRTTWSEIECKLLIHLCFNTNWIIIIIIIRRQIIKVSVLILYKRLRACFVW